jgi:nitrate reductase NapD
MTTVDRREFINGHWAAGRRGESGGSPADASFEVASILVQTRPDRLDAAARTIADMPGAQIYGRDAKGKLVVVVEAAQVGGIGETLNAISLLPGVLNAALVFHGTDGVERES